MMTRYGFSGLVGVALVGLLPIGCGNNGRGGSTGILNMLSTFEDADGDNFVEIPPDAGVTVEEQVAVAIDNEISRPQAINLARTNLPDFVTDSVGLSAAVSVKLGYPGGVTQTLSGGRSVARFNISFEVACPDSIEVNVVVLADIPFVGRRTVQTLGPYSFTMGAGGTAYGCDSVVRVRSYIDAAGKPAADATVEAMDGGRGGDSGGTGGTGSTDGGRDDDGRGDGSSGTTVGPSGTRRP